MEVNRSGSTAAPRRAPGGLGRPRLLIVGCGDIGLRIVARLHRRFRVVALTSNPLRVPLLRAAGAVALVGNLDDRATLARLRGFVGRVIHLAPPPGSGAGDRRTARLVSVLGHRDGDRMVYISTTGVYGDDGGAWLDETAGLATQEARSLRRIDAECRFRSPTRPLTWFVPSKCWNFSHPWMSRWLNSRVSCVRVASSLRHAERRNPGARQR